MMSAYSYKTMSDHHVRELKEQHHAERSHMLARARKVQMETNRRRRAQALKRKQEAQREEKRRQEILARRKAQIREATERFQRANNQYEPYDNIKYEDANDRREYSQHTPALEDALKMVRGSPGLRRSYSYDGSSKLGLAEHKPRPYSHNQPQHERIQEHARQVAARTEMQSKSFHNLNNSRNLFEKQLEEHQSQLLEKHKASLHQFTSALHEELRAPKDDSSSERIQRSDSLSSVDSLEAGRDPLSRSDASVQYRTQFNEASVTFNPYTTYQHSTSYAPNTYTYSQANNPGNFVLHSSSNSPSNVAVVQPNNAQSGATPVPTTDPTSMKPTSMLSAGPSMPRPVTNDPEFLKSYYNTTPYSSPVADTAVYNVLHAPPLAQLQDPKQKLYDTNDQVTHEKQKEVVHTRLKAWATPSPVDSSRAQTAAVTNNGMMTNTNPSGKTTNTYRTLTTANTAANTTSNTIPTVAHTESSTKAPQYPLKTSTALTEPSNSHYLSGSYYTVKTYAAKERSQNRPIFSSNSSSYIKQNKPELILDEGDSVADDTEEIENKEPAKELARTPVKSILRKRLQGSPDKMGIKGSGYSASLAKQRNLQAAATSAVTASISVKDSLEVTRQQMNSRQDVEKPAKKSVRFADEVEKNEKKEVQAAEEATEEEGEKKVFIPSPPTTQKPTVHRPPRPVSAKQGESSKVSVKARAASAGTARTGIPKPVPEPAKAPQPAQSGPKQSMTSNVKTTVADAVYDTKGLRLDRTPTDDEINMLWDRVRDCLSRASSAGDTSSVDGRSRTSTVSHKTIDGNSLASQQPAVHINIQNGLNARKKVTMEHLTNYSAKRTSALHRQQQQNRLGLTTNPAASTAAPVSQYAAPSSQYTAPSSQYTAPSSQYTAPFSQYTVPASQHTPTHNGFNKEVSDSMAAFLTAEMMSQRSASASQIGNAIDAIYSKQPTISNGRPPTKAHSALSMEEQRLLQSLERLNERLKMTEQTLNATNVYMPRPPAQPPPFRGNHVTINQRRYSGTVNRNMP